MGVISKMKKSLLLAVLPTLLILSSCSAGPKNKAEPRFVEDTLAHNEIFGALPDFEPNQKQLQPKKAFEGELYAPVLGYQRKDNGSTYSVRFVAAVNSEWGVENLTWTRSVHNLNGVAAKPKANKSVTTLYDALATDADPAYATDVEADEDGSKPFNAFAAYCLLNIPSEYSDYYVDAYMTVSVGNKTKVSSVGSLNVADSSKKMKYELGDRNRNIAEINGVLTETDTLKDDNHYNIYSLSLAANQSIRWWYIDKDNLTYALCTDFSIGRTNPDFEMGSNGELIAKHKGTYNIFLNNSNKFYFEKKIYFQAPDFWENDNTSAWVQLNYNGGNDYEAMIANEYPHQYYIFCDISYYNWIKFYRASGLNQYNPSGEKAFPQDGKCLFNYSEDTWYNV